ncbi:unnamed protein product [Porites lobata]|uniref:Uncharacterized protein n=1 Tax=Porites lobata TaxID=104759 RepID=A0ABN8PUA7_9CNID|nr:unnamed protein product [Porites lobata]CAH3187777.1 unnamed protein product [Porites lobata]
MTHGPLHYDSERLSSLLYNPIDNSSVSNQFFFNELDPDQQFTFSPPPKVPRISVLMPAELTPNNFLFCSKALKFGILYQTQSLRFLHCNRLKRKFLIFYYIDNASCTVRCCVLL